MAEANEEIVSGGPMKRFRKGWALMPMQGERAHAYSEVRLDTPMIGEQGQMRGFRSLCGQTHVTTDKWPPLNPGNFDRCKRCQKIASKRDGWEGF